MLSNLSHIAILSYFHYIFIKYCHCKFFYDLVDKVFNTMGVILFWIKVWVRFLKCKIILSVNDDLFSIAQIPPLCTEPELSTRVNLTAF